MAEETSYKHEAPEKASMGKGKLRSLEIEPAKNGGNTVTHRFREAANYSSGRGRSSLSVPSYREPETHVFGKDQGKELLAHVAKHLKLSAGNEAHENSSQEGVDA